jgi:hypothetical protein
VPFSGCESDYEGPRPDAIQKAGSGSSATACASSMANALTLVVTGLHFRSPCLRNADGAGFVWSYIFKEKMSSNADSPSESVEKCIDEMVTYMNDHVADLDIGLNERCNKKVKMFNGEKLVWAFEYRGR